MSALHLPKRFDQVSRSFKASDPGARIVLGVACLLLAAFLLFVFLK
jgi:hypothetical protein